MTEADDNKKWISLFYFQFSSIFNAFLFICFEDSHGQFKDWCSVSVKIKFWYQKGGTEKKNKNPDLPTLPILNDATDKHLQLISENYNQISH